MTDGPVSHHLSKSLYVRGRQCRKSLWLHKHRPELKDPVDQAQQARFDAGNEVGALARRLHPGGDEVPYEGLTHAEQLALTRQLVEGGAGTVYEAAFEHGGVFVKVDILHRVPAGWEILEVKASAAVKDVHYHDAAVQYFVLAGAGLPVARAAIVHVDTGYERRGAVDPRGLFAVADVTAEVRAMQGAVAVEVAELQAMLGGAQPTIDIGPHCADPYACDFHGHCWEHIPADSVFDLRERGIDRFALYREGIIRQADIPLERLNARQRQQVEATVKQADALDKGKVREFLGGLWHPLCFLDFETVNPPIPLFDGLRPYQQMPFQYSLRVQASAGAALVHHEFLAQPGADPRPELTDRLLGEIPDGACVVAWNQAFETARLRELAEYFPDKAPRIAKLIESFRDPMTLFRDRHVYLWQQKGSYSIKAVLPLLAPELSYDGMEVAGGDAAMSAYRAMCDAEDPQELARIRKALLDYCALDTLGMVRIVERLRELAG